VPPGWVSTDDSIAGVVNCCVEVAGAPVEDVAVTFGPTAPPRTEVMGETALEIWFGDSLEARECWLAFFSLGDFGGPRKKARIWSRFLGFPSDILN